MQCVAGSWQSTGRWPAVGSRASVPLPHPWTNVSSSEFARICRPGGRAARAVQLLTYECDALPHLRETPALVVLPGSAAEVQARRAAVRQRGRALRRARARHRPLGRRAAGAGRRRHQPRPAQSRARRRHPQPPRHGRAGRHQPRDHAAGRAVRLLLRARSVEPAGVLDRRQRRRELRRRALSEIRLHRAPRARGRSGAARTASWCRSAARCPMRPGRICSACSSAAKARSPSSPKSTCGSCASRRACRRCSRRSTASATAGSRRLGHHRRRHRSGRRRDDGRAGHSRRPKPRCTRTFPPADTILIVELDGPAAEVASCSRSSRTSAGGPARRTIEVAQDEAQRARIWKGRKAAFAAMGRVSPNYYVQDGVVPRTKLPEVLGRIRALEQRDRAADRQRLPRRRRQPAPADLLRRADSGAGDAGRGSGRRDPHLLRRGRRIDHRRARRRRRQARLHAADVLRRRPRRDAGGARRVRPAAPLQPRQGASDAAAVRRSARPVPPASGRSAPASPSASDDVPTHRRGRAARRTPSTASCLRMIVEPETASELAAALRRASRDRQQHGAPRRRHEARWGRRRRAVDLVVSTAKLNTPARPPARRSDRDGRRRACTLASSIASSRGTGSGCRSTARSTRPPSAASSRPTIAARCAIATARRAIC